MSRFIIILISMCVLTSSCVDSKELRAYKAYYEASENLLDSLDAQYDWVDAYDSDEYYDAVIGIKELNK